ncbi:AraC family transcriptional regulator [Allomuricauda sp. SCSIO 65647]|uniref:helix-turn-helix domain-containing protein n=1 Tax=Allomuricauda sp. SCSIO 65647 TaxID=2908843 RepID=UPI001F4581AA|nr:AraC family transcriptional regulator [Muricauda sp. SCSIO 65647]UJH68627.1 AraC family transcriptional regulator [Muricauda sp. SCSIO 65647]
MQIIPAQLDKISSLFIRNAWIVEESNGFDIHVKAFPTGYPYINVVSGTKFSIEDHKGNVLETTSYLSGNSIHPFELNMRVIKRAITIQLQPYAIPYLTGLSAHEFKDLRVPVDSFSKYLAERLETLISSDLESSFVLNEIIRLFSEQKEDSNVDPRILFVLQNIMTNEGNISIGQVNGQLNLSKRRLQQLFQKHLGLTLKSYSKVVKMQSHMFKLLNGKSLDYIVPDGYYDQSHFIHDMKEQTSMSPTAFQKFITSSEHHGAYYVSNLFYGS